MVERNLHNGGTEMRMWNAISGHILIQENIGTDEQRKDFIAQTMLYMKTHDSMPNTNDGCWRGHVRYVNDEWYTNAFNDQLNTIVGYYLENDTAYTNTFNRGRPEIDQWTNVNQPGSLNILHSHKAFEYSAVYYLSVENTGDIVFLNPANLDATCSYAGPGTSRLHYTPKAGDLLMWPGWIPHEVERNPSNSYRINIATNIRFVK